MNSSYFPQKGEHRMKFEGNDSIKSAREYFMTGKNRVLYALIKQRFSWMNDFIKEKDVEIRELGCGAGMTQFFINNDKLKLTDILDNEWVDEYQDALNLNVPDESQDVIICSHMIHHIANPASFLDSVGKKLKKGGRLIIQYIYTGTLMKFALRIMRHEGWSDVVDIFDRNGICNDPSDPWSANCSIPKLLFFSNDDRFKREFPEYRMIKRTRNECFLFLTSGGVNYKTVHLPVGDSGAKIIQEIDRLLIRIAPNIFGCGCSVVLLKNV